VFGDKWPGRLECGKDASFTFNVVYSTTATEAWGLLRAWFFAASPGARSMDLSVPDATAGSDRFAGEVRLNGFNFTSDPSDPKAIMVTFSVVPDGEITRSTIAS